MEKIEKKGFFTNYIDIFIAIIAAVLGVLLGIFGLLERLDLSLYDTLLKYTSEPRTKEDIVLIDIDDRSLNEIGEWPWSRDVLANVLLRLKEFESSCAIFDIEFVSPSAPVISKDIDSVVQDTFIGGEESLASLVQYFASAIESGDLSAKDSVEASVDLVNNSIDPVLFDMMLNINRNLRIDNDDFFARTLQFFGNSTLTINMRDLRIDLPPEDREYAVSRMLFDSVEDSEDYVSKGNAETLLEEDGNVFGFTPATHSILNHAASAGFTNVVLDKDGTRRRVELLSEVDGKYAAQLVFTALLHKLDVKEIKRRKNSLILVSALLPGESDRRNIKIPLDKKGRLLINWLEGSYAETFKHVGVFAFKYLDDGEKAIYELLKEIQEADKSSLASEDREFLENVNYLIEEYNSILLARTNLLSLCEGFDITGSPIGGGLSSEDYEGFYKDRNEYFSNVTSFASSFALLTVPEDIKECLDALFEEISIYNDNIVAMREVLEGSFCIIGNSATGSTDMGVTPFQSGYANLGTHANIANTILLREFITPISWEWGAIIVIVVMFFIIIFTHKKGPGYKAAFGLIYVLASLGLVSIPMLLFRIYLPAAVPIFIAFITYLLELAFAFAISERNRSTLRRGFAAYVAPDVVTQIVKNPEMLGLGGVNRNMTALFSDVKTFSGFTETVNNLEMKKAIERNEAVKEGRIAKEVPLSAAELERVGAANGAHQLVQYLNVYLGALSDAIYNEHGTVDKYVGDEIVSFFGAPLMDNDHAWHGLSAAIRMLQAETLYNQTHEDELPINPKTGKPFYLRSRVGLNTGDMVVGNMGTEKKINYTIMGNNVNLASRLEGTNKAYDSWIMCSESTWKEVEAGPHKGEIVARQLDCVKVINVEKPVQIYSIQGFRNELSSARIESVDLFNEGMKWYLKGYEVPGGSEKDMDDFRKARKFFLQAQKCFRLLEPDDPSFVGTEQKFIDRCDAFINGGLPLDSNGRIKKWDGVYVMKSK